VYNAGFLESIVILINPSLVKFWV